MLAEIRRAEIILFLGAGASSFAGYHTFASFPDLLLNGDLRSREKLPELHYTTQGFLREVQQTLTNERLPTTHDKFLWRLNDYSLFSKLVDRDGVLGSRFLQDQTIRFGEFAKFRQLTENAIADITNTTILHYGADRVRESRGTPLHDSISRVHKLYCEIARINNPGRPFLPIFTTNYDMLLEDMFAEFPNTDVTLTTGIKKLTEGAAWDAEAFHSIRSEPRGLYLFRVHGCVCWFYHGYGDEKTYFHRRDAWQLRHDDLCTMYPGKELWRGRNPHAQSFREFEKHLITCKCVVFIGFSFRDDDLMHLLLSANARRETPLTIITLDPTLSGTDIEGNLGAAAARTQFPVRVPKSDEIRSLELFFGARDFDSVLLETLKEVVEMQRKQTMSVAAG